MAKKRIPSSYEHNEKAFELPYSMLQTDLIQQFVSEALRFLNIVSKSFPE